MSGRCRRAEIRWETVPTLSARSVLGFPRLRCALSLNPSGRLCRQQCTGGGVDLYFLILAGAVGQADAVDDRAVLTVEPGLFDSPTWELTKGRRISLCLGNLGLTGQRR
jgi:hypothetical protein